ncbi:N-terminal glutamine amidase-domain-containing protein [Rhodocollybia butyracea]|uniref:Protein N-terminal glutamine amidohydrolase n=1 Tax=Rhodocollybia butyracea TaxID=206335 RepID=A0A9P5PV00_9AGAR|nr:N-terminal glutamine amidase-domain-containing protein [Rhodocollybia butyracea]
MGSTTRVNSSPPPLPENSMYTSHWCEENVYLLMESFTQDSSISELWEPYTVFISNHAKSVALLNQKISKELGSPVVWDYHAIAVLRPRKQPSSEHSWVYDFDTQLEIPATWDSYFDRTFSTVPDTYQSIFRVVPAATLLDHFASDRSHMLNTTGSDAVPDPTIIPPYPNLRGKFCVENGITHNLMDFISMRSGQGYGDVLSVEQVCDFFGSKQDA